MTYNVQVFLVEMISSLIFAQHYCKGQQKYQIILYEFW